MSKRDYQLLGEVTNDDIMFLCRANIDFYREPPEIYYKEYMDEEYMDDEYDEEYERYDITEDDYDLLYDN